MHRSWMIIFSVFIFAGIIIGLIFVISSKSPRDDSQQIANNLNPVQSYRTPTNMPTPTSSNLPTMIINSQTQYTAVLVTSAGKISILLDNMHTPITANNFVYLARKNFYNNTIFHRVISGFMIQGGDPSGNGTGGPGYTFADEPFSGSYTRGTVAMANSGPNTNGSQFFIMHQDYGLPPNYVIFGHVTAGLDVVDKIATAPVEAGPSGENSKPVNPVKILSVEIIEKKLPPVKTTLVPSSTATPSATPGI